MAKVLLVEDDATMLALLRTLLEIEGYQVVRLNINEEPLSVIRREKPDIVLLDVHLRNANGLDVMRQLRQDLEIARTRVLMASGSDVSLECKSAGADGFIMKPFMPDDLISAIRRLQLDLT